MTFYLKYRPQTINDLDIASVRDSLNKIIKSGSIPHAFLFAGGKGTGKTSSARILAKIINCEAKIDDDKKPCNKCKSCISITNGTNTDVIEMDAASNRGIDDIRALRDVVRLAPLESKDKVYIIDEAHMLTPEASNALLKTLEEPPSHVYFILATTNPEKLIDTIRSRTVLINFTKATPEEIARSLGRVADAEKIKVNETDLKKIAKLSKGSFRDAVKILEQFSQNEKLFETMEVFEIEEFLEKLSSKDVKYCLDEIGKASKNGTSSEALIEEILVKLRKELLSLANIGKKEFNFEKNDLVYLIELLLEAKENLKISPIEELPLEVALIKWCGSDGDKGEEVIEVVKKEEVAKVSSVPIVEKVLEQNPDDTQEGVHKEKKESVVLNAKTLEGEIDADSWNKILGEVKPVNATIEALLRSSKLIACDGRSLKLGVYYKFHKDKLEEMKIRKLLEDIAGKVFNSPAKFECIITQPDKKEVANVQLTEVKNDNIMAVAEEIFNV